MEMHKRVALALALLSAGCAPRPQAVSSSAEPATGAAVAAALETTLYRLVAKQGIALGTAQTEAEGGLPNGGGSWSGSVNTFFFIDPKRRGVALLMTHFLNGTAAQAELRGLVNRSCYELVQGS